VLEGVRTVQHERLTIQEAAHRLGMSESAVRKRIKRGALQREKTEDGRVLVYMEPSVPGAEEVRTPERDALISEMQQRLALLERELDVRTEEIRRRDTIIMNMTEAMKALNPPAPEDSSEVRESPESHGPTGELGELREELDTERTRRERAESTLREGMDEERRRREEAERERDDLRRELFARREPRESPQTVEEEPERAEPHPDRVESPEAVQRSTGRSLWRRIFRVRG
jgi:chromosome segregation ATPase